MYLTSRQANPRLATQKDDDERLPIHWAVSYNHLPIVELLVSRNDFDPDVQVLFLSQET
jgi:26S proteasome non-ATPase regulatory subunit 10